MTGKGAAWPPLVADRRYPSDQTADASRAEARSEPKPKAGTKARSAAAKPKPGATSGSQTRRAGPPPGNRNFILRMILGLVRSVWRIVWGIGWRVGLMVALALGLTTFYFYSQLPPLAAMMDARTRGSVTLLDRNDKVFAWRGETFGGQTSADTVSPYLKHAVIATEDKRYYSHIGISPRGIASAISINLSEGRGPLDGNGGSTITQQVAKLLCLGTLYDPAKWKTESDYEDDCRQGGVWRKIKEIPYAIALEAKYGKENVLTIYFNRAYLGAGARGFEAAAQRYFGISANEVNPAQAAMLAGLLKAPSKYAPTSSLKRAQDRGAVILGLMHDQGYLTDTEYAEAKAHPAQLSAAAEARAGGYFADWVMESGPDFLTKDTTEDVTIRTTLDQRLQKAAEDALRSVFETKVKAGSEAEAGVVVMSADGAVRAMVGGRHIQSAGSFNRATQALRQTGSTFKPFVYAAALDLGYTMNSIVDDAPVTIYVKGSGNWTPKNYEKEFHGPMTLTDALAHSVNTATVRVSEAVGRDAVRKVATDFGFAQNLADGPALALGVSESTLVDMTGAYAGILNGGSSVKPYGIVELKLKGDEAPLMGQDGGIGERVISENAARQLTYMMTQVIERGTGRRARLEGYPAAGKTGTTQAARDAWFIGFTADYVVGVWMGYDDNRPLSGVTGGGLPADIWHEVMARVEDGLPAKPLPMIRPEDLPQSAPAYPGQTYGSDPYAAYPDGTQPQAPFPDDQYPDTVYSDPPPAAPEPTKPEGALIDLILRDILNGGKSN